ncbi:MAG: DUF1942 domain-containing protein [Mycobacterium sp.]
MRRWLFVLTALLPILSLAAPSAQAAPAETTVATPIGRVGDTLRVRNGDLVADVTVVSVTPSDIPAGWGYPPRPPREQVWRANIVVQAVQVPTPTAIAVSFQFRGVTPTGDAYEPRATDDPADLPKALAGAAQGATVAGAVFWDCYRDLVSHVVLIDKKSGLHLAQWNL